MPVHIPTKEEFLAMLPAIREAAKALGYAVGVHGSLERDFDLMAIPWTEEVAHSDDVAEAIKQVTGCVRWRVYRGQGDTKPHGRIVYCFDWDRENHGNQGYIDLSVMPKRDAPVEAITQILGMDTSFPTWDILEKLIEASEMLLHRYSYDGHGWELINHNIDAARERILTMKQVYQNVELEKDEKS